MSSKDPIDSQAADKKTVRGKTCLDEDIEEIMGAYHLTE